VGERSYGVGLVGAGPVAQAIHLPTLERLGDRFSVVHVADVNATVAQQVALRAGARWSDDASSLIADPDVEVVVIGTPDRFHADQVIAACLAGKAAVLCEKPLAESVSEANAIAEASARTGVPVIVGTMHAFDTSWISGLREWDHRRMTAHTVRISAVLPPNPWAEDFATQITGRPQGRSTPPRGIDPAMAIVRGNVLGLAIHDLPLARRLLPDGPVTVLAAHPIKPWGVEIVATVGDSVLEIHGSVGVTWEPKWTVEAISEGGLLRTDFPLSYVHAGSGTTSITDGEQTTVYGPHHDDGYLNEWEHIYDILTGELSVGDLGSLVADLAFALDIADQAGELARTKGAA